ncbi:unnamed protein product [Effrenium voratum]|nr:unnamed protein product [Effrenium voratum]
MRVGIHVLKRTLMDLEPTDTVEQVKSKLERVFLQQLEKQGEEEVEEVDVTLTFQGEVLQDNVTLAEAGVREGSTLFVLSRKLAEVHGKHSGVYHVRRAFEELAESGLSGPDAEQQALKTAPPFSLFCNIQDLGELGAGWVLFFHFVRALGLLCLLFFVLQLPSYFTFRSFDPEELTSWRNHTGTSRDRPISWDYITAGNTGPNGADSPWPWACALVSSLLMLVLLPQYSRMQHGIRHSLDKRHVDPDDFAIFIDGLPSDARDEQEIKEFVEQHGREGKHTEVALVVISYDADAFQTILSDIKEAKEELAEGGAAAEARLKELRRPFRSSDALRAALPCTGQAVVVLRSQHDHREVLDEWDSFYEWLMSSTQCLKINSRTPRFRKRNVVRLTRASNPSDILWENLSASHQTRLYLRAKTYTILALTLIACLVVVVAMNWALDHFMGVKADRASGGLTTFSSLLVAFTVMVIRIRASLTIRKYVMQQKHMTKTGRDVALLAKLALFYLTCYCLIAVLVNWDPLEGAWYNAGGLVSDIASLMTFNCITIPAYVLLGFKVVIRNMMRDHRLDLENPPPGMTQSQYQTFFELPDMDQTRPFAKVLLTFLMGFVFMPMWPYAILIAAAALFMEYWAFKYQLLRQSKRPYRQSYDVAYAALRILYIGTAGFAIAQEWFLAPSLSIEEGSWSSAMTLPLLIAPLVLMCLSMRVQRLLCGGFLCKETQSWTASDVDYYTAQRTWPKHQKYHTTSMVYLRGIEVIDATARKLRWDPRTGNLPDPGRPGRPSPPESTSGRLGSLTDHGPEAPEDAIEEGFRDEDSEGEGAEPEETEAIAGEDPAALAMEEIKHKVPLSMIGGESDDDGSTDGDSTEESGDEAHLPLVLAQGRVARITGLQKAGTEHINGQTCKLLWPESGKWIVQLSDGRKAAMATEHLQLKAKIVNLRSGQGKLYNGTANIQGSATLAQESFEQMSGDAGPASPALKPMPGSGELDLLQARSVVEAGLA